MTTRLYRVVVDAYPESSGSPGWAPKGWRPTAYWIERHGPGFFWPSDRRLYRSRSSAVERAALLESYGATVHVERTAPLTWETVPGRLRAVAS